MTPMVESWVRNMVKVTMDKDSTRTRRPDAAVLATNRSHLLCRRLWALRLLMVSSPPMVSTRMLRL